MSQTITINNEPRQTEAQTLEALAKELALPERGVAVAINNHIHPRATWTETTLSDGDNITIIKAAFGG